MGGELSGALSRLEGILVQSRAAIVPLLHPGIDQAEVVRLFAGVGLIPSAEVVTWYGWHDGAGAPGLPSVAIDLVPGGEFYDLGYLCGEYQQARSAAEYVASTTADLPSMTGLRVTADDLWRISWFPLLRLFGKGYVAAISRTTRDRRRRSTSSGMTATWRTGPASPGRRWVRSSKR